MLNVDWSDIGTKSLVAGGTLVAPAIGTWASNEYYTGGVFKSTGIGALLGAGAVIYLMGKF